MLYSLDLSWPLEQRFTSQFPRSKVSASSLKYGVSSEYLWVQGRTIDAKTSWSLLVTWQVRNDWLVLSPAGIPQIYLPITEIKKAGVYDHIMELAKKNGKEFK
jgi:hypothetical protein